jgi:type VI secretion system protein ImpA
MSSAASAAASSETVIDVEALLAPIPGENPAGQNLQYAGLFDEVREARRADDNLEMGAWKLKETKTANWPLVVSLTADALANKTKDLQVCVWLTEALVKLHGLAGLRDGLRVMRGLHELFWEGLYPEIDEGDLEARANALSWLDKQAALAIVEEPLTNSAAGLRYSYRQWQESMGFDIPDEETESLDYNERERVQRVIEQAAEENKITSKQWRTAKHTTARPFYEHLYAVVNGCWAEFEALDQVMDEKFGRETPGLSALKKSLDAVRTQVEALVTEKRALDPDPEVVTEETGGGATTVNQPATDAGPAFSSGLIGTRQEALKRLAEVAAYFHKTEPHSPVAYLVQRAIKWGQMPLEVWLQEVIKDSSVMDHLRETLGLKAPPG